MGKPRLPGWRDRSKNTRPKYKDPLFGAAAEVRRAGAQVSTNPDGSRTHRATVVQRKRPIETFITVRNGEREKANPEEIQKWKDEFGDKLIM
jgi:hypothetical protein